MNLFDAAMLAPNISELIDSTSNGNRNQLDGLQGGVPFSEVTVKGKNLIDYPYFYSSRTINGVIFTDNGDGTITVDGTSTAQIWYFLRDKSENTMMNMADGIYTLSGCPDGGSDSTYKLSMVGFNETDGISWSYDFGNGVTVECNTNQYDKFNCYIYIGSGVAVDNLVFRPMLELGDTATEYVPPITGQELTIGAGGENLAIFSLEELKKYLVWGAWNENNYTIKGVTLTVNNDGTLTANGTATDDILFSVCNSTTGNLLTLSAGKSYILSGQTTEGSDTTYYCYINNISTNTYYTSYSAAPITVTPTETGEWTYNIRIKKGAVLDNVVFAPFVSEGNIYVITPDSSPYTVPTEIYQQDGMNTVYVTGEGEPVLSVKGVKENAAVKKIWDKLNELTTAIIVSNGEI